MKLFTRFVVVVFGVISFALITSRALADITSYRSAATITTDGSPSYTNLSNCFSTDTLTCDRSFSSSYANLYFKNFGDFAIPSDASLTNLRLRVTGKATASVYAGISLGSAYSANCQTPSDLWTMFALNSSSIATYSATTSLSGGLASCLSLSNIQTNNFIWRINYSSGNSWSANIDNFEIAFDYTVPTPTPTSTPTPTPTPTPNTGSSPSSSSSDSSVSTVCSDSKPGGSPTLLSATALINAVKLNWSKATDPVSSYLLSYGSLSGQEEYGSPNIGGKDATTFTVGSLASGKKYYFRIKAVNNCTPGDYSNELSAMPLSGFAPESVLAVSTREASLLTQKIIPTEELKIQPKVIEIKNKNFSIIGAAILVLIGLVTSILGIGYFKKISFAS